MLPLRLHHFRVVRFHRRRGDDDIDVGDIAGVVADGDVAAEFGQPPGGIALTQVGTRKRDNPD